MKLGFITDMSMMIIKQLMNGSSMSNDDQVIASSSLNYPITTAVIVCSSHMSII